MARKHKKAARIDLATEDMLLAEEDLAAMRPALAVAPELIVQTLQDARRRSAQKRARKKAVAKKKAAKKTATKARKSVSKKKKSRPAVRKKKVARKK